MERQKEDYMEIDLLRLMGALRRRAWAVVLAMLLCGGAAFSYTYFLVTPLYQASALMYVNNSSLTVGSTSVSLSDLTASQTLVDTYIVILKTRLTLNDVIEQAKLQYSYEDLRDMIDASPVNSTEIFEITATSPYPAEAEKIANTIAKVLPEKISEIMDGSSVRTVDFAVRPAMKSSPSITRNVALGLILGMLLSCGAVVVLELLDQQIRDEAYLTQAYGLPVLAAVPDLLKSGEASRYGYGGRAPAGRPAPGKRGGGGPRRAEAAVFGRELSFAAAEAYRLLRTNLLFALPDEKRCRAVGVTSAGSGEGKSTTALNLSHMLAEAGERVLLIEGDMRLPTISAQLKLPPSPGLSNVLAGLSGMREALRESGLHKRLQVIPSGDIPPNPSELLGAKSIRILMEVLSGDYDFIVFDLPPVTEVADALVASRLTDGTIVVVRQDYANRRALADAMGQLGYGGAKVLGFVMTRAGAGRGQKYRRRYGGYGALGPPADGRRP